MGESQGKHGALDALGGGLQGWDGVLMCFRLGEVGCSPVRP